MADLAHLFRQSLGGSTVHAGTLWQAAPAQRVSVKCSLSASGAFTCAHTEF